MSVSFAVGLWLLASAPASGQAAADGSLRHVAVPRARLLREARGDAVVLASLRMGAVVRLGSPSSRGPYVRVRTPTAQGFVLAKELAARPPSEDEEKRIWAEAVTPSARVAAARRWAALSPGSVEAARALMQALDEAGDKKGQHMAHKGLIAAERRALSWDGPLYPIVGRIAFLPAPCWKGVTESARERAVRGLSKGALRARAFPWVSSGKVVSLTEVGERTERLDAPVCVVSPCALPDATQAGYALVGPGTRGALVPSWLVAGFRVVPFRPAASGDGARVFEDAERGLRVTVKATGALVERLGFEGWQPLGRTLEELAPEAEPMAQFSEDERWVLVLWTRPSRAGCCPKGAEVWLTRHQLEGGEVAQGRAYRQGFLEGCAQETFSPLPGEPRCEALPEGCELGDPGLEPAPTAPGP